MAELKVQPSPSDTSEKSLRCWQPGYWSGLLKLPMVVLTKALHCSYVAVTAPISLLSHVPVVILHKSGVGYGMGVGAGVGLGVGVAVGLGVGVAVGLGVGLGVGGVGLGVGDGVGLGVVGTTELHMQGASLIPVPHVAVVVMLLKYESTEEDNRQPVGHSVVSPFAT